MGQEKNEAEDEKAGKEKAVGSKRNRKFKKNLLCEE